MTWTPTEQLMKDMHGLSFKNKRLVASAGYCGCFHCLRRFPPNKIVEWADGGETAICPFCGVDSVLANDGMGFGLLSSRNLRAMQSRWFSRAA